MRAVRSTVEKAFGLKSKSEIEDTIKKTLAEAKASTFMSRLQTNAAIVFTGWPMIPR